MGMFGVWDCRNWRYLQLSLSRDMLAIQIWDCCSFLGNLRIAMLMEVVGVGPQRYCIVYDSSLDFYSKLKLILYSLPQEKMFLFPTSARLEGPFLHELGPKPSMPALLSRRRSMWQNLYVLEQSSLGVVRAST